MPLSHRPPESASVLSAADRCRRGARVLVDTCADVKPGEKVLILSNPATRDVAEFVEREVESRTPKHRHLTIEPLGIHGAAPPPEVGPAMLWADVVFGLTLMSLAHSSERKAANDRGTRYLSLPDYSLDLLGGGSLCCDFDEACLVADRLKIRLDRTNVVRVRTALGTDVSFTVTGRSANACPGLCRRPGMLGSPPDAEVNIAPLEGTARGVVHVDGSIPCREIGRLREPIVLEIERGMVIGVRGTPATRAAVEHLFDRVGKSEARWLAEFGIGLNPLAELTGRMLEDEGCADTIHFGFGSNATIGGTNRVPFHLDFIVRVPTVELDGLRILEWGKLTLPCENADAA